jgi:NADPH:quinone reductase-like Zn-dependent oxidoreductase
MGLGATQVIDRNLDTPSLIQALRQVLPGEGVQFIYDTVSLPDTLKMGTELLATGGRMIYTVPGAAVPPKDGKEVVLVKGNPYIPVNKELATALYAGLAQFLEDGSIKVSLNSILNKVH